MKPLLFRVTVQVAVYDRWGARTSFITWDVRAGTITRAVAKAQKKVARETTWNGRNYGKEYFVLSVENAEDSNERLEF
ncbi:MAG: hypothetical protein A3A30_03445 [Candidatus Terrybacteria bacterium RIFCSPLOWO2_01_FULL_48_14]|nr:MAG: hypothetical protein A3A30_03445 [Candidatus Terrybacteria bacterium RIFCSPLOWO2_01_FULL_48_14]